jgi:hypothetical protein
MRDIAPPPLLSLVAQTTWLSEANCGWRRYDEETQDPSPFFPEEYQKKDAG